MFSNIGASILILPIGLLITGVLSCFKRYWVGLIPIGLSTILYLSFHYLPNYKLVSIGDCFFELCELSIILYAVCRLITCLIRSKNKDKKKSKIDKSKVQDL